MRQFLNKKKLLSLTEVYTLKLYIPIIDLSVTVPLQPSSEKD